MTKVRFQALDVMRGLTLALMILVNTPGSWSFVYSPLLHANWHGATPTDYIFPFFLFMVGAAMVFSQRGLAALTHQARLTKIIKRTFLIFLIGLLLNYFPFTGALGELRILGVLQRIALAYCVASLLVLYCPRALLWVSAAVLLIGYWALLQLNIDPYGLETSLVRDIDLSVLGANHMWQGKGIAFDPEGLLSTLPSVVNVLIGYEATRYLIQAHDKKRAQLMLTVAALVLILISYLWQFEMPYNKYLWTSSFVLVTSGVAILVLMALIKLESLTWMRGAFNALTMLGKNPLFIYALSILWAKTLSLITVGGVSLYQHGFIGLSKILDPFNASLAFALLSVAVMWLVAYWLDRKNIIIAL